MSALAHLAPVGSTYPLPTGWAQQPRVSTADPSRLLKRGIWAYFLLVIFEGALRKWFLPSLATPLLVVRDPLALWLVVATWKRGLLPANGYLTGMVLIGVIGLFTAVLLGHGNLLVALYGARVLLLHFPLLFVIGRLFTQRDVLAVGKVVLWICMPMTVLIALQFYSPQSAWVNRGVGGNLDGAGFSGALDYLRPPGTFSFTNGVSLFYSFATPFILYFWLSRPTVSRLLLWGASVALLAAIPLSISRGLLFQIGVTLLFLILAAARKPGHLARLAMTVVGVAFALAVLNSISFFRTATEALSSRFESASGHEGGLEGTLGNRYLGGLLEPLLAAFDQPFFGHGLGMGTNVGSMLLTGGQFYLISEGEWGRLIGELGPLMGLAVVFIRLGLSIKIAFASYHKLVMGDLLPWLLLSTGAIGISQALWAQPTSLGFSILTGGLLLASLRLASSSLLPENSKFPPPAGHLS